MKIQDFVKLLRNRWVTVAVTAVITILVAAAYTGLQVPLYQASTRLFVSTASGVSVADAYSGNRLSQERVLSYSELISGATLAQRTIDRLGLDMSAETLKASVTAKAKPDTVLIEVSVLDSSPVRARDIANALSDEFVIMVRELETPNRGAKPEARVVVEQRASIPEKPLLPKKARNLVLSIIFGGMLGIGLAFLRDLLDNTVKSQETLEAITGTSAVGSIPLDKQLVDTPTISFDTDDSSTAEAFRKLRTNLQFLAVDDPPRVIVVVSSSPSEGKTTTAINIGLALAEAAHNVVLVDGDLRRPRLARYAGVLGSVGVSTVLSGGAPLDQVLQNTRYPNLTVLAAGPTPPNPSELLGSLAAEKMLAELRSRFDYVIVDTAPLLAVTDGAILAAKTDGALVVVKAGRTRRDQLAHAIGTLNDVGATLLGSILTMMPTRGSGAYGYYYSGSYGDEKLGRAESVQPPSRVVPVAEAEAVPDTAELIGGTSMGGSVTSDEGSDKIPG